MPDIPPEPASDLDSTDLAMLARLQVDGRIANVDLAEEVSLSPSSCLRRTKALEARGVIAGYRAELDRERLGLGLTCPRDCPIRFPRA